jgi:hypothetical protein
MKKIDPEQFSQALRNTETIYLVAFRVSNEQRTLPVANSQRVGGTPDFQ